MTPSELAEMPQWLQQAYAESQETDAAESECFTDWELLNADQHAALAEIENDLNRIRCEANYSLLD